MLAAQQQPITFDAEAALAEASRYHHTPTKAGFPYLTWCWKGVFDDRMKQKPMPVNLLGWLIEQIGTRPDFRRENHYIVQAEFKAPNRRALNLWTLGLLWSDIDLKSYDYDTGTANRWTRKLLADCTVAGIPEPSIIVWSGRGLHAKWTLDKALPAQALPRWAAAMRHLHNRLASLDWPADDKALDVSRILRIAGTYNPKADMGFIRERPVFVTHSGPDYSFDAFCDAILPYTRAQVEGFREDAKARIEAQQQWAQWDENRKRAGTTLRSSINAAAAASTEAAQGLWWHRLDVIRQAAQARGGIQPGQRNSWMWIAANALGWGLGDAGQLWLELPQLAKEIAPSLTDGEAKNAAASVYQRLKQGGRDTLYRMRTDTLVDMLGLEPHEARLLRGNSHPAHNPGVMGFEKLHNLPYDVWLEKVRERQSAGGKYSNEAARQAAVQARRAKNEDRRASARLMAAQGVSTRAIAAELCVDQSTVVRWLKG